MFRPRILTLFTVLMLALAANLAAAQGSPPQYPDACRPVTGETSPAVNTPLSIRIWKLLAARIPQSRSGYSQWLAGRQPSSRMVALRGKR